MKRDWIGKIRIKTQKQIERKQKNLVLSIASGEIVAEQLRKQGKAPVLAMNEAMCEKEAALLQTKQFIMPRIQAYGIDQKSYVPFYQPLK